MTEHKPWCVQSQDQSGTYTAHGCTCDRRQPPATQGMKDHRQGERRKRPHESPASASRHALAVRGSGAIRLRGSDRRQPPAADPVGEDALVELLAREWDDAFAGQEYPDDDPERHEFAKADARWWLKAISRLRAQQGEPR